MLKVWPADVWLGFWWASTLVPVEGFVVLVDVIHMKRPSSTHQPNHGNYNSNRDQSHPQKP